ncbi:MAG: hypothetical protein Q9165_000340 [Trypethelium subeluteriae]
MSDFSNALATPYLDPINQAFLKQTANSGAPQFEDLSVAQFRKLFDQLQEHKPIPGVSVTSFDVPFNQYSIDNVKAYIFKPEAKEHEELPAVFYLHGGGWIAGNAQSFDGLCRQLALLSGCALVFPEYTLAPDAQFPVQNEQCFTVIQYFSQQGASHGLRTDAFGLVADTAGGQLSPVMVNLAHTRGLHVKFAYQVLFCPWVDTSDAAHPTLSEFENFTGPFFDTRAAQKWISLYVPEAKDRLSSLASPLLMSKEQAASQPPTLVAVSDVDPLRSEGLEFAKLLQQSGADCAMIRLEACLHDCMVLEGLRTSPTAQLAIRMAAAELNRVLIGKTSV